MLSFSISLVCLIIGYLTYGRILEKVFGANPDKITPVNEHADGVDYVQLPIWKIFLIQFLNIAGTGPIFGAIMGAMFGPSCYIWIVLGSIFAGGVHDYMSGMLSLRNDGQSFPNIVGMIMGKRAKNIILAFTLIMLLFVGPVFIFSPALILGQLGQHIEINESHYFFWIIVIFLYYVVGTIFPINKIIGRIYPIFGFLMLFMAISLMVCLFKFWPDIPEIWDGLQNRTELAGISRQPIFPCLCITVACGAISGFHSTQSPIMAKCISNEKYGRPIFYGSMIAEGAVALIWAAVSSWFFFDGGMTEIGIKSINASEIVSLVSKHWLGAFGGFLAIIGVVAAPITTGDTAFRSARIIISEALNIDQRKISDRFKVAIPIFVVGFGIVCFNMADSEGFNKLWRYFGLSNQFLACVVLWCATVYLRRSSNNFNFLITFIPACFMTSVCLSFFITDKNCLGMSESFIPWICVASVAASVFAVIRMKGKASE